MAPYRRVALIGHTHAARAWPLHRTPSRPTSFTLRRREFDAHDAQPLNGLLLAVPLGIACWGAIAGLAMGVSALLH